MDIDTVEGPHSRWLGGRGTRVLYLAIALSVAGALMTGQSVSQARAESEKATVSVEAAVKLATEVSQLCRGEEFRRTHEDTCLQAEELLKDPSVDGGAGPAGVVVVDAVSSDR